MSKRPIVLFDDVFFALSNSGIAKFWSQMLSSMEIIENTEGLPFQILILNRSGYFSNFSFQKIDFPDWDQVLTAADRRNIVQTANQYKVDAFVSSYDTYCPGIPNIKVIYDLIPEKFGFSMKNRAWLERTLSLYNANKVLAISKSTLNDLRYFYPKLENVSDSIVYPGVSQQIFYPRSEEAKTQIKQNQKINKFIIYVGSRARDLNYKNCNLLFEMLATTETFDFGLVFIGGEELTLEEREILQKYEFRHLFPTDEELAALISAADCLVSTSLYEGFGMPVLEALACGTPVIATNTSSLPEAHGDLALTISGSNSHELYDAILASTGEEIRKEISHAGPEHASNFNWMNSARILVNEIANSIIDNEPKNRNWLRLVESYELLMLLSQY